MPIEEFINPPEEAIVHEVLSDADILESAQIIEEDEIEIELEKEEIPKNIRLQKLEEAWYILENDSEEWNEEIEMVINGLTKITKCLRREIQEEKKVVQMSITSYFSQE